jgi:uncharacterized protein YkwD
MGSGHSARPSRARLLLERLETRELLSGYQPTAVEQLFLEELNDARANPAAYGASIGLDLSTVAPSQPLAFNTQLIEAARLHSQDMDARGYFSHTTPEGLDPGARISQAGFFWNSWGESIAGGSLYPNPSDALSALIIDNGVPDLGHRLQLLAMTATFQGQNQVGIGILQNGTGPLTNYYTIDTASSAGAGPFLTGVVFNDANGNGKYDVGEGLGGVTITVNGAPTFATWASGGYAIPLAPGTYTVTASGPGLPAPITQTVTLGGSNVRLNFTPSSITYIRDFYQTILGRQGSNAEVNSWLPALQVLGPAGVASLFEHSQEAREREVTRWYVTYLGRQAQGGEEQGWVNALLQGLPEESALAAILGSDEFYDRAGTLSSSGTGDQRYIQALYSVLLSRTGSAADIASWVGTLRSLGRQSVALHFLQSMEYRCDEVRLYYASILNRSSAPSSAEIMGWAGSNLDLLNIRVCFESSHEYYMNG